VTPSLTTPVLFYSQAEDARIRVVRSLMCGEQARHGAQEGEAKGCGGRLSSGDSGGEVVRTWWGGSGLTGTARGESRILTTDVQNLKPLKLFVLCGSSLQERPQIKSSTTTLLPLHSSFRNILPIPSLSNCHKLASSRNYNHTFPNQ
jgi:hypothetical protein